MDPALLTTGTFWNDSTSPLPGDPRLAGHVLFTTSGSSGKPKSVALSKSALLVSAAAVNRHLDVSHNSRWGLALPLHHVGGFGVAARVYESGSNLCVYERKWNATQFRDWLARENITHTSLVPTQVHDLVMANAIAPTSVRAIVVGGGRLEIELGQRARQLGWPVLASYGMSETASQIATQPLDHILDDYQPSPIPLLPIWAARTTADSRLEISGPALFSGYVIDGIYHQRESDWHLTSDRVKLSAGSITPLSRADNIVKVLGELVDPAEIERELCNFLVSPCCCVVIAIPDDRAGHLLIPVFENSPSHETAVRAVSQFNSQTPGYRRLQPPQFIAKFSRSELGKIRRGDLADALRTTRRHG